jgi:hypothetical protein
MRPVHFAILPMFSGIAGAAIRTGSIVELRLWHSDVGHSLLLRDRLSYWLAEEGVTWFFNPRRIGPSSEEALLYDVLLVLGLAAQCALLGAFVQGLLSVVRRTRARRA